MNIALVAMSGIRVQDEELLALGLTLPGFVERSKTIAQLPSLGLLTLAGMTPPRHKLAYIEAPDLDHVRDLPDDFDLVAISSYSAQIFEAYELAARCRRLGVPVVIGGPHVSCLPEEAARHCDAVVVGEGESSWQQVLDDCEQGRLGPVYGSLGGSFELGGSPMPAFELLKLRRYNRLTLQTSRGCPHRCEFCASSVLFCGQYKQKPVAGVLDEVHRIQQLWKRPFLEFADDNAIVHKHYWRELLSAMRGAGIRWFAETDVSVADDEGLLELMRESGCAQVLIGLESPTPGPLGGLELHNDWKRKRWAGYRDAIQTIQAHGIAVNGCFVIGLDGHGPEVFDQVYRFVEESELYDVQITILTPFPGTPLYDRLERAGRLTHAGRWDRCTLFDLNFRPAGMSAEQLVEGFRKLTVRLYGEEFTRSRKQRFRRRLRDRVRRKGVGSHEEHASRLGAVRSRRRV